jgi:hypothetical protein
MKFPDWTRAGGWVIKTFDEENNPWNVDKDHKLVFMGIGEGTSDDDFIRNMTVRPAGKEATHCTCEDGKSDKVKAKRNTKTYTITRSYSSLSKKWTLSCDGGSSGGASWTAEEGG